ncbi:hypothetical protein [Cylindrospermopsis raciborskii]|uniref:hypothetical protein n=1 Tax=Cylindrospermopsis raciborskii TaxID=77022 RepID=UPI0038D026C1
MSKTQSKSQLVKGTSQNPLDLKPEVAISILGLFSAANEQEGIIYTKDYPIPDLFDGLQILDEYTEEEFNALSSTVDSYIDENKNRLEDLIPSAISSLLKLEDEGIYCEIAYVLALLIMDIDEELSEADQDYLLALQEALKIPDDRAEELIDEIFDEEYEDEEEEEDED